MNNLNIRTIEIARIREHKNNPKLHNRTQIAKIRESIREFGFVNPVLLDENLEIIAGHGRWKETDTTIARRISDGAIGTDMESSALFAFGVDRKTSVVSISVLSDEIHNSEGDYKGLSDKDIWFGKVLPKMTEAFETIIKVVTE